MDPLSGNKGGKDMEQNEQEFPDKPSNEEDDSDNDDDYDDSDDDPIMDYIDDIDFEFEDDLLTQSNHTTGSEASSFHNVGISYAPGFGKEFGSHNTPKPEKVSYSFALGFGEQATNVKPKASTGLGKVTNEENIPQTFKTKYSELSMGLNSYNTPKDLKFCIARLKKDLEAIFKDPAPLMFVAPEEDDITQIHALICGPEDTPYQGGFFYFFIKVTSQYPLYPPKVKFMTTDNRKVRFNPNLYNNGKVCLSLLGTWPGPPWSVAQSIQSLLISIQSLLNSSPYDNEPGFRSDQNPKQSEEYNEYLRHETLRVAVCGVLENEQSMPSSLYAFAKSCFLSNIEFYENLIEKNLSKDGKVMHEPYLGRSAGFFNYNSLKMKLTLLKEKLGQRKSSFNIQAKPIIGDSNNDDDIKYIYNGE